MTALVETEMGLQVRYDVAPEAAADRVIGGSPSSVVCRPSSAAPRAAHWREIGGRHVIAALVSQGDVVGWVSEARGGGYDACPRLGDIRWYATEAEARRCLEGQI